MKEHFSQQFKENKVVTQEVLDQVPNKTYTSGREIKPGDIVLFAFLKTDEQTASMICLHEDELDKYECIRSTGFIPQIKTK